MGRATLYLRADNITALSKYLLHPNYWYGDRHNIIAFLFHTRHNRMCAKVHRTQYILSEENMPGGIFGPITHMLGTSNLSSLVHCLNVQVATASSHQKRFIEMFILSLCPKVSSHTHFPSAFESAQLHNMGQQ